MQNQPSVIVVGAGFSGLAAAEELHALGCKVWSLLLSPALPSLRSGVPFFWVAIDYRNRQMKQ